MRAPGQLTRPLIRFVVVAVHASQHALPLIAGCVLAQRAVSPVKVANAEPEVQAEGNGPLVFLYRLASQSPSASSSAYLYPYYSHAGRYCCHSFAVSHAMDAL